MLTLAFAACAGGAHAAGVCRAAYLALQQQAAAYNAVIAADALLKRVKSGADKSMSVAEATKRFEAAKQAHHDKSVAASAAANSCP